MRHGFKNLEKTPNMCLPCSILRIRSDCKSDFDCFVFTDGSERGPSN